MNYFLGKKKKFHGIMFHHFHDDKNFKKGQGSLSGKEFKKIIKFIGKKNIISPELLSTSSNLDGKVCLTFDDGLKCQYKIARPILKEFGIKAFFFIFSNILEKKPDLIEVNRIFRLEKFDSVNQFYKNFFDFLYDWFGKSKIENFFKKKSIKIRKLKKKFPFYSIMDIKFRLIRDTYLDKHQYNLLMRSMYKKKKFDFSKVSKNCYLNKKEIKNLSKDGHFVGLHSHSHPTNFSSMNLRDQRIEYKKNKSILEKIIKKKINSMSHPCGSFDNKTLRVLNDLRIKIGFNQNLIEKVKLNSDYKHLFLPREDHANIIKNLK